MKRKPNKPRPEAQTHTEPGSGLPGPAALLLGLALNRSRGAGTSGQMSQRGNPQSVPEGNVAKGAKAKFATTCRKASRNKRRHPSSAWKSGAKKREAAQEKLAKQKPPKQKGPIRKAAGAAGWGRSRLCAWQALRGGTGKCRNRRGPPLGACRGGCPAAWLPVCKTQSPGASGKGGQPGRGQVSESGGGLSFPHRRTGAPGAFPKTILPGTGRNSGLEGNTRSGRRRPQNRAQKPPGKQLPPRKS